MALGGFALAHYSELLLIPKWLLASFGKIMFFSQRWPLILPGPGRAALFSPQMGSWSRFFSGAFIHLHFAVSRFLPQENSPDNSESSEGTEGTETPRWEGELARKRRGESESPQRLKSLCENLVFASGHDFRVCVKTWDLRQGTVLTVPQPVQNQ